MPSKNVALDTLLLLEARLARLDFYLSKRDHAHDGDASDAESVATRLTRLERRLAEFCSMNPSASEMLKLQSQLPEELNSEVQHQKDTSVREMRDRQLPEILASEDEFQPLNSQLPALQGQQVPDAKHLAALVTLQPRLDRAAAVHRQQSVEVDELRRRSAAALATWYEQSILQGGEQWVEAERQLSRMDLELRRAEHAQARDDVVAVEG